jgi:peroxiredoxin
MAVSGSLGVRIRHGEAPVTKSFLPATLVEAFQMAAALDAPLSDKLAFYAQQTRHISPRTAATYDRAVERLSALEAGQLGPQIGEPMPDFLMPDQSGRMTSLADLLGGGPVVISLNRGHWCPYCRLDLRSLAQIAPEIEAMGGRIVSIMPEVASFTKKAIAANDLKFPILTDLDLSYVALLGLIFWMGPEMVALYADAQLPIARFQGNERHFLPIAGKFVLDRNGIVRAREVNLEFRTRMQPARILETVKGMI